MADNNLTRILIVDDEAPLMKALCDTLRHEDLDPVGFTSAAAALEALKNDQFELLLTDLMMPEMDGIELLEKAQKLDPNLVGILMTGQGTIATAVEAMKKGALDYVLKPFKVSAIMPVLSRALIVRRLRIQNEELQQSVQERTLELEAANKDLEAFSYSVSHDLRAPLRAISGFSAILLENHSIELSPEVQRKLKIIISNTAHMSQLIEDLLRFSRLGRQSISRMNVKVTSMVDGILLDLQKEQSENKFDIRIGELPDCIGDPSLLKQVFINLLSNAFKFSRHKEQPVIEIGSGQQNGKRYYFVRDNGAGFDMKYANRAFEVFQRLHSGERFEGTGVGLSIVQRIISKHGGEIWVEAEVDKGATFYFTLPA